MKNLIVGMGEVLWDILPDGKKVGGAPANFCFHISQFGLPSIVISAVGNDVLGKEIIENFKSGGLPHYLLTLPFPTGSVNIEVDSAGVPNYVFKENVAWDNVPFDDEMRSLAKDTKVFCFGSLAQRNPISRTSINHFIDAIPKHNDPLIVFDANLRQDIFTKNILHDSMTKCNVLKINDEELEVISHMFDITPTEVKDRCSELINKYNLRYLILTCGTNGSYVFTKEKISFQPTPKVDVIDTVGAGDSFTASFIANILKGKTVEDAHKRAVEISAFVCTQPGAMPLIPQALKEY